MAFDKSKFLAANQAISSDNPYPEIEPGFYVATLFDANFNNAKSSGRYQASFIWEFDESETKLFGKKLGSHIGLDDPEGKGYKALNGCLYAMGVSQSQIVGEFAENPDAFLERLIGTKARLEVKKDGDFTNTRVKKLISSPLKSNGDNIVSSPALQQPVNTTTSTPAPTKEVTISIGMDVLVNKNGVELPGKIISYQEATNEVLIKYEDTSLKAEPVNIELVRPNPNAVSKPAEPAKVEEVVEDIEEVKEPVKLEIGMQAVGKYEGKDISGEIYKIEGDVVKLKVAVDGKFKAFPCPKGSIVVNVPF